MRPRLRPTLSRKVKYWGIAPTAQKKLGREARRGEYDLRKLVGHANFLDVLASELDISDDEDEIASPVQERAITVPIVPAKDNVEEEHEELHDDDEDTASDSWSECESSDEEDYALMRTISGRPSLSNFNVDTRKENNSESVTEIVTGYFQSEHSGPTVIADENVLDLGLEGQHSEDDKKGAIVTVAVASATMTPLATPTKEIQV